MLVLCMNEPYWLLREESCIQAASMAVVFFQYFGAKKSVTY